MIITNLNNRYVKIQSDYIQEVINEPSDYSSIEIEGDINCCTQNCTGLLSDYTLNTIGTAWYIDLDIPTKLNNNIVKLKFQNLIGLNKLNVITTPIDLGYVEDNCNTTCTLQTFSGTLAPLFKTQIDTFFLTIGIVSNVTISFTGNILSIDNIPNNFIPYSIEYGIASPYTEIFFGFSSILTHVFLGSDGLYVNPLLFGINSFIDGVYKFNIKINKVSPTGYIMESNCTFIDVTTKCKVAALLHNIKAESMKTGEKPSTVAHLLHYALVNGSNCGCNCDELCKVYNELYNILTNVNPQLISDCGC